MREQAGEKIKGPRGGLRKCGVCGSVKWHFLGGFFTLVMAMMTLQELLGIVFEISAFFFPENELVSLGNRT